MDIKLIIERAGRKTSQRLQSRAGRLADRLRGPAPPQARPATGWELRARLAPLTLDGYTFRGAPSDGASRTDAGFVRSPPCRANCEDGGCPHTGCFIPISESHAEATAAAEAELDRKDHRAWILSERRWISAISIRAESVFDMTGLLGSEEAEYVLDELIHGYGSEEPAAWRLAKQHGCQGVYLPTAPPTLLLFMRAFGSSVRLAGRDGEPVRRPLIRPTNALDFVRRMG